jgi:hypothetical protein
MQKKSLTLLTLLALILCVSVVGYAQKEPPAKNETASSANAAAAAPITITAATTPADLARAALAAQGGEKFKNLKNMILIGTVDLYPPNSTQSIPGKFYIVTAGDKVIIDIDARPAVSFKQIYNGQQSYSSMPGVSLPPASKFGPAVLAKFDQPGYTVSALPDKKKQRGFRIVDAEGNTTDFYLDPATGRVVTFLIPYNGYTFGTENKKMKELEGILVSYNFTQRLEMPQGAFFAEYTVKDVKLNQSLSDDVFAIPN